MEDNTPIIKWFGPPQGYICNYINCIPTPVSILCFDCNLLIELGDSGFSVPSYLEDGFKYIQFHRNCFIDMIGVGKSTK